MDTKDLTSRLLNTFMNKSALGALVQGKPDQFIPRLKQSTIDLTDPQTGMIDPNKVSFAGDMRVVNPGGFAAALPLNTRVDQMTSQVMGGPSMARPGFDKFKPITPSQSNVGQMQVNTQAPDLTMYEQAMGKGGQAPNFAILERLSAAHPGDARFSIHKTIMSLMKPQI